MAPALSEEAEALLTSEPRIGHLATCTDGDPHVAPLWYNVHDGHIEIATTGRKLANLRSNPQVAISVQKDVDGSPKWGVVVQGTAEVVDDAAAGRALFRRLNERYGTDEDAWMEENTPLRIDVGHTTSWRYD